MPTQPPAVDLSNAVDFTVTNPISGATIDQGFATLVPNKSVSNDETQGNGMILTTTDSSVGVPVVPNPVINSNQNIRWQRYEWNRRPNAADTNTRATLYSWNPAIASDPTYLCWIPSTPDLTAINTQLSTLNTSATSALAAANTANTNSTNALNQANAAVTVANNAAGQIGTVSTQSSAAASAAATANTLASQANSLANTANANANAAVTAVATNKNITQINPGASGQRIRVNDSGSSLEYYNASNTIVILQQSVASFQNLNATAATTILFDTNLSDLGGLVTNLAAGIITLAKGVYKVTGRINIYKSLSGPVAIYNSIPGLVSILSAGSAQLFSGEQDIMAVVTTNGTSQFKVQSTYNAASGSAGCALSLIQFEKIG